MADGIISKIQLPDNTIYDVVDNTSGYMTGMTILSYGSSTWQNFIDAYSSNKVVYCRASSNANPATGSQTRLAFMAYVNNATTPTEVEFQYYRSVSSHTASQQGDQVFVYKLNKTNGWSVTVREASVKVVAGTGLGGTYSKGTMTLTGPTKVSDLTNDSGFITGYTETDPVFNASAAANITSTDISAWNGKQESLVSGTNIKTINNTSLLGSGNITIDNGAEHIALTQAEYDVLPSTDKNNPNKIYFITDGSSSGGSGSSPNIFYGICTTTGTVQAKTVTVDSSFSLTEGVIIIITFQNRQYYYGNPTLNVNNTGAKAMKRTTTGSMDYKEWYAGATLGFMYNGTDWVSIGITNGVVNSILSESSYLSEYSWLGTINGTSFNQGDSITIGSNDDIQTASVSIIKSLDEGNYVELTLDRHSEYIDDFYSLDYDILGISFSVIADDDPYPNLLIFHPKTFIPPIDEYGSVDMSGGVPAGTIYIDMGDLNILAKAYVNYYNMNHKQPPIDTSVPTNLLSNINATIYYKHNYIRPGGHGNE